MLAMPGMGWACRTCGALTQTQARTLPDTPSRSTLLVRPAPPQTALFIPSPKGRGDV